jgi:hypothetical protein
MVSGCLGALFFTGSICVKEALTAKNAKSRKGERKVLGTIFLCAPLRHGLAGIAPFALKFRQGAGNSPDNIL